MSVELDHPSHFSICQWASFVPSGTARHIEQLAMATRLSLSKSCATAKERFGEGGRSRSGRRIFLALPVRFWQADRDPMPMKHWYLALAMSVVLLGGGVGPAAPQESPRPKNTHSGRRYWQERQRQEQQRQRRDEEEEQQRGEEDQRRDRQWEEWQRQRTDSQQRPSERLRPR